MSDDCLQVVSVSLGSSSRDKRVEVQFGGRRIRLVRVGADGDLRRARELIAEHDLEGAVIGLGGTDLWLHAGERRYPVRDAHRMAAAATRALVVDGSGLKNLLEREVVHRLQASGAVAFAGKRALLVSSVDRWGMARGLSEVCADVVFGDLMFALGIPIPLRGLNTIDRLARAVLPIVGRLPFRFIYPTGERQEKQTPKHGRHFAAADIIAGDFHFIRRFMPAGPAALAGKVILTNTTTEADVALLRERGAALLAVTTPRFEGRSFGTNVIEAMLTAVAGSRAPLPPERLLAMLDEVGWEPEIERLQQVTEPEVVAA